MTRLKRVLLIIVIIFVFVPKTALMTTIDPCPEYSKAIEDVHIKISQMADVTIVVLNISFFLMILMIFLYVSTNFFLISSLQHLYIFTTSIYVLKKENGVVNVNCFLIFLVESSINCRL